MSSEKKQTRDALNRLLQSIRQAGSGDRTAGKTKKSTGPGEAGSTPPPVPAVPPQTEPGAGTDRLDKVEALLKRILETIEARDEVDRDRRKHSADEKELEELKAELERREAALRESEKMLDERERYLEESEALLLKKGQELIEAETGLEQLQEDLGARKNRNDPGNK